MSQQLSNRVEQALTTKLVCSSSLFAAVGFVHLLGFLSLYLANTPHLLNSVCTAALIASLIYFVMKKNSERVNGPLSLEVHHDGKCRLLFKSGRDETLALHKGHFVSSWLIVMHMRKSGNRTRSLIFLAQDYDVEFLRRLRVLLRYGARTDLGADPGVDSGDEAGFTPR